ncbi:13310_t:CDS:2 [Acaulospora morrowiae]|uniref:13310_t:CDS:1 n=1 Tax=Acaulospora morrowiae TaxID=94023 RepID=A0A9N9ASF5_9GLOM|nr:13310_t:CDS:2 [Acaulospora morrowiae]
MIHTENTRCNNKSSRKKAEKTKPPDFRYVNGRRYHNEPEVPYWLPSDLDEIDRQQQQHYCGKHIFGSNISAPVEEFLIDGCKVLDVGCGAGIWLLEMATEYKKSKFFGVDMSPVFPTHIKPFNTNFIKANMLNGLTLPSNEFDYIHISFMNDSFTNDQWQNIVIPELVRLLKPDGWLEFYDFDTIQLNGGPLIERFFSTTRQLLRDVGVDPRAPTLFKQWLSPYTCLKDINELSVNPCMGTWKCEVENTSNIGAGGDNSTKTRKQHKNDNFLGKSVDVVRKEVKARGLVRENCKLFYVLYAEELSKLMGISQENYLKLLEECFEQEMEKYETRMVFTRVICRKSEV